MLLFPKNPTSIFHHTHPYQPFNLENATKLIVGTLPPPRFTSGELKKGDVNFSYGSIDGMLWPILDKIFDIGLVYEDSFFAVQQRQDFLRSRNIGICDIVNAAYRDKVDASDLGMQDIELRDIFGFLSKHKQVNSLIFTGGNSKNGPEYFFRKAAKKKKVKIEIINDKVPRKHQFTWDERVIQTVSLTAPSGAANRAIGSLSEYKLLKTSNSKFNTFDFRVLQYAPHF